MRPGFHEDWRVIAGTVQLNPSTFREVKPSLLKDHAEAFTDQRERHNLGLALFKAVASRTPLLDLGPFSGRDVAHGVTLRDHGWPAAVEASPLCRCLPRRATAAFTGLL